ncbi:MAG: decaprenyl-phosphate phosphoribosyltransferase [Chloroflexota bacterium]
MSPIHQLWVSARPHQWYKNGVLLIGIVFSANLFNYSMWDNVVVAVVIFSALSSAEYLINDVIDRERDRAHPTKRNRPIASGRFAVSHALAIAAALTLGSLVVAWFVLGLYFLFSCVAYVALTLFYSLYAKHALILDIVVISTGFVVRAIAGCFAIGVFPSSWLIVCAFLLALLLAVEKRGQELTRLADGAGDHRPVLEQLSARILETFGNISAASLLVSYLLYTGFTSREYMWTTIPLVILGLFRYLYLVRDRDTGAEPHIALRDGGLKVTLGLWVVMAVVIAHLSPPV